MWKSSLRKNLHGKRKLNIVIFGATDYAKNMLEDFPEYNFIGIIDNEQKSGRVGNVRVLSYKEAALFRTEIIILTKQLLPTLNVYEELTKFCLEQNIILCDVYGNDLLKLLDEAKVVKQKGKFITKQEFMQKASAYDVLSFDIFDTLLMRKTLVPEDVFLIVEAKALEAGIVIDNFKDIRIKAQLESGLYNPDIYEVYNSLQILTGITDEQKNLLLDLEISVENEVLVPRYDMVWALTECKKQGKKIILVSDMYIPKSILQDILYKKGIDCYDEFYVSCDEKRLKNEGLLEVLKCHRIDGKKILHIGDSYINDGICAGMLKTEYLLISSGYELMRESVWSSCITEAKTVNDRSILGLVVAELFNSPFVVDEKNDVSAIKNIEQVGYVVVAPIIISFLVWMIKKLKEANVNKVLFAARDGYIVKELYDFIANRYKLPESVYFYTSRKCAVMSDMANEAVINMLIDISYDLTPSERMSRVFGLADEDILPWTNYDCENIHQYVWKHAEKIFEKSKSTKKKYFRYMGNAGLEIGKRYVFLDFVSSGTCQKSLMRFVPFEMTGMYFAWNSEEDKNQYDIEAYYNDEDSYFMDNYKAIEVFMTSYEPSLTDFSTDGEPIFTDELRNEDELERIKVVHKGVRRFGEDYFERLYVQMESISHRLPDVMFQSFKGAESEECNIFSLDIVDDWKQKRVELSEITGTNEKMEETK